MPQWDQHRGVLHQISKLDAQTVTVVSFIRSASCRSNSVPPCCLNKGLTYLFNHSNASSLSHRQLVMNRYRSSWLLLWLGKRTFSAGFSTSTLWQYLRLWFTNTHSLENMAGFAKYLSCCFVVVCLFTCSFINSIEGAIVGAWGHGVSCTCVSMRVEARDWHQASPPVLGTGVSLNLKPPAVWLDWLVHQVPENSFHSGLPIAGITHVFLPCPAF